MTKQERLTIHFYQTVGSPPKYSEAQSFRFLLIIKGLV